MSWEWSHSPEAYANAQENLGKMSANTLAVILSEWEARDSGQNCIGGSLSLDIVKYRERLRYHRAQLRSGLVKDALANSIWEHARKLRTCTNGGHMAWMCPFGCGCHMVSFSTFAERMAEAKQRKADNRRIARVLGFNQ